MDYQCESCGKNAAHEVFNDFRKGKNTVLQKLPKVLPKALETFHHIDQH